MVKTEVRRNPTIINCNTEHAHTYFMSKLRTNRVRCASCVTHAHERPNSNYHRVESARAPETTSARWKQTSRASDANSGTRAAISRSSMHVSDAPTQQQVHIQEAATRIGGHASGTYVLHRPRIVHRAKRYKANHDYNISATLRRHN